MSSVSLIEAFGRIVYGFTRGLTEHYNPQEPEYTAEILGCNPLESTGREWYYKPVRELIYQEYGEKRSSPPSFNLDIRIINASSTQEHDELQQNDDTETAMAWKKLRPSILKTICDSMYIGSLISLLAAISIGTIYIALAFLIYKTVINCQYQKEKMTSRQQWMRTIADVVSCALIYFSPVLNLLFLFRSFQLKGLKQKLLQTCLIIYCLDSLYRVTLQLIGKPFFTLSGLYNVPVYILWLCSSILQFFLVARHFLNRSKHKRLLLLGKMSASTIFFSNTSPRKTCGRCSYHEYVVRINRYSFCQWLPLHVPTDLSRNDFCHKHNSRVRPFHFSHAGNRMVFHQRFSSNRDSISKHGCYGCMALSMEATYFSSDLECIVYRRMGHRESLRSRAGTLCRRTLKKVQNAFFLIFLFL